MASTAPPGPNDRVILERPSSWPVRRERQRHAQAIADKKIQNIENIVLDINRKLCSLLSIGAPPGLANGNVDCSAGDLASLANRVQRLESLLVCAPPANLRPSVDEVLEKLLSSGNVETCSSSSKEPETEASPLKLDCQNFYIGDTDDRVITTTLADEFEAASKVEAEALTMVRAAPLAIDSEKVEQAIQTEVSPVHKESIHCQTETFRKARRGRINGRAAQTDSSCLSTCDVGVQCFEHFPDASPRNADKSSIKCQESVIQLVDARVQKGDLLTKSREYLLCRCGHHIGYCAFLAEQSSCDWCGRKMKNGAPFFQCSAPESNHCTYDYGVCNVCFNNVS